MKIATWNINSVRLRLDLVLRFLQNADIDVLCLQETKTQDEFFPVAALADVGWEHSVFRGEKSYNGVAIISRLPVEYYEHRLWAGKDDCRHICARINGVKIHNFYVPAGGDVADRDVNPKFGHKIDFLDEMKEWFSIILRENQYLLGISILHHLQKMCGQRASCGMLSAILILNVKNLLRSSMTVGGLMQCVNITVLRKYYIAGGPTARETGRHQTGGDALIISG